VQETQTIAEAEIPAAQNIQETTIPETQTIAEAEAPEAQNIQEANVSETQTPPPPAPSGDASESE
jgi:hypothetical protein